MSDESESIRGSGHQCACVHFDRFVCAGMRYQRPTLARIGIEHDPCDCGCHDDYDEDEDEGEW